MIILAYGVPGAGKSLLLHDLIRTRPEYPYFVVEHSNEWEPAAAHWRGRPPRVVDVWSPADVPDRPEPAVYRCINLNPWAVCRLAIANGPAVYVDDELDVTQRQGDWLKAGNPVQELVHRGRHIPNRHGEIAEVHLMGAARRPQSVAYDVTALASEVYVFRVRGHLTRTRLEKDDVIDPEQWDRVSTQPNFHFLHSESRRFGEIRPL